MNQKDHPDILRLPLNRTSVGLKLRMVILAWLGAAAPQSNQRGIETWHRVQSYTQTDYPSIEPAWD